jgi:hypothetical protein
LGSRIEAALFQHGGERGELGMKQIHGPLDEISISNDPTELLDRLGRALQAS